MHSREWIQAFPRSRLMARAGQIERQWKQAVQASGRTSGW